MLIFSYYTIEIQKKGGDGMQDSELIALFEQRDERAISGTEAKYGRICRKIAREILGSRQDAEEIVNDVLMQTWNAIPPEKPRKLFAYLAAVTRNLSTHRLDERNAQRRGGGHTPAVLDELNECIASPESVEQTVDRRQLKAAIQHFLDTLPAEQRILFVLRYNYVLPIKEIAKRQGIGESKVKVTLLRIRNKLHDYLEKEGLL